MKMNRYTLGNNPNYRTKKPKLLYIDRFGNIYPDCKTYKTPRICHITDSNVPNRIKKAIFGCSESHCFNMVTIEVSSLCQANCVYCFQRNQNRNDTYKFYDCLLPILKAFEINWLFFSGGEILVQKEAMDFMRKCRSELPNTWIHLKTNGNVDLSLCDFVDEVCNSIMVSFNGFSPCTYKTIMSLDIKKTISFCEEVNKRGQTNLGLKFLISPINIAEIPDFLDWALSCVPQCIALQVAYNYKIEKNGTSSRLESTLPPKNFSYYWDDSYERIENSCKCILKKHESKIVNSETHLTIDKELIEIIRINENYAEHIRTDGVYIIE